MVEGEIEDCRGMVMEDECVVYIQNLVGRLVLVFVGLGILICVVGAVVVGGVFFGKRSMSMTEMECSGVSFTMVGSGTFNFGGDFKAVVVEIGVEDL